MTVQKYAVVDGSAVTNIILLDEESDFTPPPGNLLLPAPENISIGWLRSGNEWVSPTPKPEPVFTEDPDVTAAKNDALVELTDLGMSEATAKRILGLT